MRTDRDGLGTTNSLHLIRAPRLLWLPRSAGYPSAQSTDSFPPLEQAQDSQTLAVACIHILFLGLVLTT
jgi:hypothetical protein